MEIKSVFSSMKEIPRRYTCDGENINPPIEIIGAPTGAKSFALIVDDPDAPMGTWVHWVMFNIPTNTKEILENSVPTGSILGMNDSKKLRYGGPCPPSGTHRYFFKLYALDIGLKLSEGARKSDVERKMQGHILEKCELVGTYARR
jgi:Raf kinase inhibitor-like YbhB/YbcL family protein